MAKAKGNDKRCERILNADELTGLPHTWRREDIHECGRAAAADVIERHHADWTACAEHAYEAERDGATVEWWSDDREAAAVDFALERARSRKQPTWGEYLRWLDAALSATVSA